MTGMIDSPEGFFRGFIPRRDALIEQLEAEAERENIPIVGPVVGELLGLLARISRAQRILELGTATGYSTIYLARGTTPWRGRVVTLERDAEMAQRARKHLRGAGVDRQVEIRTGDALTTMAGLKPSFDLVFLDIEKADYIRCLPHCERLLRTDGLLVADNVAFRDAEPFVRAICQSPRWRPVHLFAFLPFHSPEHDALCVAMRT